MRWDGVERMVTGEWCIGEWLVRDGKARDTVTEY